MRIIKGILILNLLTIASLYSLPSQLQSAEVSEINTELVQQLPALDASWEQTYSWRGPPAPEFMAIYHPREEDSAVPAQTYIVTKYSKERFSGTLEARVMKWLESRREVLESMSTPELLYCKADTVIVGEWSGTLPNGRPLYGVFLVELKSENERVLIQYHIPEENEQLLQHYRTVFMDYARSL